MLRTTLCCLLLAATAAIADPPPPWPWERLEDAPYLVRQGSHITYGVVNTSGDPGIWGVFPVIDEANHIDATYAAYYSPLSEDPYDPNQGHWHVIDPEVPSYVALAYTGFTFQWDEAPYVIGADTSDPEEPPDGWLFWYSLNDEKWYEYDIDEEDENGNEDGLVLGPGACIAYAPNAEYSSALQIEGWIYCLPGDGREFWRKAIGTTSIAVAGIFPPTGSTIADPTPLFKWNPASPWQYRLQVSTVQNFSTTVIDVVVYDAEYQTTSKLTNGEYFWRVGTPYGLNWFWGTTRNFVLQGTFEKLTSIPEKAVEGAAMAYFQNSLIYDGEPQIFAVTGYQDVNNARHFYRWNIQDEQWTTLADAPKDEMPGTSLTTPDPVGGHHWCVGAAFGQSATVERPWSYNTLEDEWFGYDPDAFGPYPQPLGPGATFVVGPSPFSYLTPGARYVGDTGTYYFYAIDPEYKKHKKHAGGSQAGDAHTGSLRAQVIASNNDVKVEYQLPAAARVRATLHDAAGRQIGVLDIGVQESGTHRLSWNQDREGRKLASGAYFVLLNLGREQVGLKAVIR
jgi:hypothetical protein